MSAPETTVRLELECPLCGYRPPGDATMESFKLHFNVEHDTDEIKLNLSAICQCGATMRHTMTEKRPPLAIDFFQCDACGKNGTVTREPKDEE